MKFDIIEVLTQSWKIIWKYKALWIFGILASCGRVGFRFNFEISGGRNTTNNNNEMTRQFLEFAQKSTEWITENPWTFIILIMAVGLLLGTIQIFLATIGSNGLIRGVYQVEMGVETLSFSPLWRESLSYVWRIIGLATIVFIPVIIALVALCIVLISILLAASSGSPYAFIGGTVFLFFGLFCCFFPFMIALGMYYTQASRALLLEDLDVSASIKRGWEIFTKNIIGLIVMGVILFFVNLIAGIVFAIPVYMVIFPVVFSFLAGNINSWGAFILAGIFLLLYSPIILFLHGVLTAYAETIWTLIYIRVAPLKKEENTVIIESNA